MKPRTRKQRKQKRQTRHRRRFQKQRGGLIEDYSRMFDIEFDDKWILTGSEAVRIYASLLGLEAPVPNDVDILYASKKEFRENGFRGFQRQQSEPMRSMTFENRNIGQSFDVNVEKGPLSYYLVFHNGTTVRLYDPEKMLRGYASELSLRGEKREANVTKMNILEQVIDRLHSGGFPGITGPHMLYAEGGEPQSFASRFGTGTALSFVKAPSLLFNSNNNL